MTWKIKKITVRTIVKNVKQIINRPAAQKCNLFTRCFKWNIWTILYIVFSELQFKSKHKKLILKKLTRNLFPLFFIAIFSIDYITAYIIITYSCYSKLNFNHTKNHTKATDFMFVASSFLIVVIFVLWQQNLWYY